MKRTLLVVTAILMVAATTVVSQTQLDRAKDLMKQKKTNEAIAVCHSYLQSSTRDENGWLFLAKAYQQIGKLDSAEIAAKRSVQLDDEMLEGYTTLAQVQLALKNPREAVLTARNGLKTIKKKLPHYPPLLVILGQSLLAVESADSALLAFAEAKELEPLNIAAHEGMGDAYSIQKVAPMAISSYEKSLEIDSLQPRVLYKLANTYTKERQYTDAARVYSRILGLDQTNDVARLELARLFFRAKQWIKCSQTLKKYFETQKNPPKDIQAMYMEALFTSRQYKEAAEVAKSYLILDPKSPLANRSIAFGCIGEKQYAQAVDAFKKLEAVDTLQFEDYRWLGKAYKETKKDSLAAFAYEEALKIDTTQPTSTRAYLYGEVGSIWMYFKHYRKAAEFFHKRIQLDSTAVGASLNLALCLIQLEEYENAISVYRRAIAQNPKYPPAYLNLSICYSMKGDIDASRKEAENAIKAIDTAETKFRLELAQANRIIAVCIMQEKRTTIEGSQKKWEEAIVFLKKSLKSKEDETGTHLRLGQCYQNLNKVEDAIKEYKRALQLDPKNEEAKKSLNDLLKLKP